MDLELLKEHIHREEYVKLKSTYNELIKEIPELAGMGRNFLSQPSEKRLSLGLSKKEGRVVFSLLVLKEDSWAFRKAKKFEIKFKGHVYKTITGISFSAWPEIAKRKRLSRRRLKPGLSIGGLRGYAGTLGCYVKVTEEKEEEILRWFGVTSAAHVLALSTLTKPGDIVLVPGYPDGPKAVINQIGTLKDYTLLVHYLDEDDDTITPLNDDDVAIVKLDQQPKKNPKNSVPNPKLPRENKIITGMIESEELFKHIGEEVFKIGRTTGFTKGIIDSTNIYQYPILLPNRKNYLFTNVVAVKHTGKKAFSQPGDSGALVYNEKMQAIGFVIGGSNKFTIVIPISDCLSDHHAELL